MTRGVHDMHEVEPLRGYPRVEDYHERALSLSDQEAAR